MRRSPVLARLGVLSLLLAIAAGCTSSSTTSQASSDASPPAAGAAIKIGIDLPVSGADASIGIPTRNGAVQAIEDADAKGVPGGFKFVAYDLDDAVQGAHDPAQGAQNVKTFVSDPAVLAMLGPFNSNVAKAEIPITNDAGLAQISPANTATALTKGDDAKKLRVSHPDTIAFFRVNATDDRQGAAAALFARKAGFKRAFIIDDNETYGTDLSGVFETEFRARGGTVLGHEHLSRGQNDYKALLTKARALSPDIIFYGGTTSTGGGLLRKQMGDVGLGKTAFIGGDGISDQEFISAAGDIANGGYFTVAAADTTKLGTARAFLAAYKKRWNADAGPYSANAYTVAQIAIAAIEKAIVADGDKMPTRAEVLKNVAATKDFPSPIGSVTFDANGDTTRPILSLYKIENGKAVFVDQYVSHT
jgi:branched-chain amino acid transport system substrate-binding protein